MVDIHLEGISKRYTSHWVFRNLNYHFAANGIYGIEGRNGSGKSTLLKIIAGVLPFTLGKLSHMRMGKIIQQENWYTHLYFTGPYAGLEELLTLEECVEFHLVLKPMARNMSVSDFFERSELAFHKSKRISELSSGLKQRFKLALAFCTQSDVLLLDEPCSNLDQAGKIWYYDMLTQYSTNRTVLIASNEQYDFWNSDKILSISDYQKK